MAKKRIRVKWIEYHEEVIECDPEELSEHKLDVAITSPTYRLMEIEDTEVLGDIEPEWDAELEERNDNQYR